MRLEPENRLFHGADFQRANPPKIIAPIADFTVAIVQRGNAIAHTLQADTPSKCLIPALIASRKPMSRSHALNGCAAPPYGRISSTFLTALTESPIRLLAILKVEVGIKRVSARIRS